MPRSFARSLAEGVIHEYEPRVPKVFLVLPALKPVLDNATDVTLLGMIYRVVKNRNRWVSGNHRGYKTWQRMHQFIILILLLFAIADTALYIYAQVLLFSQVQVNAKLVRTANSYLDVHLAYTTLYLLTSLEILACIIFIAIQASRQKLRSRVSHASSISTAESRSIKASTDILTRFSSTFSYWSNPSSSSALPPSSPSQSGTPSKRTQRPK